MWIRLLQANTAIYTDIYIYIWETLICISYFQLWSLFALCYIPNPEHSNIPESRSPPGQLSVDVGLYTLQYGRNLIPMAATCSPHYHAVKNGTPPWDEHTAVILRVLVKGPASESGVGGGRQLPPAVFSNKPELLYIHFIVKWLDIR